MNVHLLGRWLLTEIFYSVYQEYIASFCRHSVTVRAFDRILAYVLAWNSETAGDWFLVLKL